MNGEPCAVADAVIIGGGFYGSVIAIYLAKSRRLRRVVLLERESSLMGRASYNNQARVHNGYHYPRSFTTAFRSRVNSPRFARDWPQAVKQDFVKLYAIARYNSKVTSKQFMRFCDEIGANIMPADARIKRLFEPRLIEDVFLVEECAFDATRLADWAVQGLQQSGVEIHYLARASAISRAAADTGLIVAVQSDSGTASAISTRYVFNCSYSCLNQLNGDFPGTQARLKQEVSEIALIQVPSVLKEIGVTVMDGSFFSIMPFPPRDLHTLSHVRYTPHFSWEDERGINPYQRLYDYDRSSRFNRMIRDAGRYLPGILGSKHIESLYEVKTLLVKNEVDDGRPILFEKHAELPGCYSVLGGKLDNIFDIVEKLDEEIF